jgi:NAD(P)-dependent dehydrogenase (short-subunit alcohol dehydrogenase family)
MLLKNKVGVITGVGSGLGRTIALTLAKEGTDVVLASRNMENLQSVADEIRAIGRQVLCIPMDITIEDDCKRLANAAIHEFGQIDILINNAATKGVEPFIEEVNIEEWQNIFEVNVFGNIQVSQAIIPYLKSKGGAIVYIGATKMIAPRIGGIASAKAAMLATVQCMARELGGYKIRANSVLFGPLKDSLEDNTFSLYIEELRSSPLTTSYFSPSIGEDPSLQDIANLVVFLSSDKANAITGKYIEIDGGVHYHP